MKNIIRVLTSALVFFVAGVSTGSSQQSDTIRYVQSCLQEADPSQLDFEGHIVYFSHSRISGRSGVWQFDAGLNLEHIGELLERPDNASLGRSWMDPINPGGVTRIALVIFEGGRPLEYIPWPHDEWTYFNSWTLDGRMVVQVVYSRDEPSESGIVFLDYRDGSLNQEVFNDFPHVWPGLWPDFAVSPRGDTVIYRASLEDDDGQGRYGIVLADIMTRAVVWKTSHNIDSRAGDWSPDGEYFAFTRSYEPGYWPYYTEIALVDTSGQERILTTYNEADLRYFQSYLAWSPDTSRIAFWLYDHETYPPDSHNWYREVMATLAMLDTQTSTVHDLCLSAIAETNPSEFSWSPDNSAFVYIIHEMGELYYVDLANDAYIKLDIGAASGTRLPYWSE